MPNINAPESVIRDPRYSGIKSLSITHGYLGIIKSETVTKKGEVELMINNIYRKCQSWSHNIYSVWHENYHYILIRLNREGSLLSLFVLLGESILLFLTITIILLIGMGWG